MATIIISKIATVSQLYSFHVWRHSILRSQNLFSQSDARLPIRLRHGDVTWIIWDKRKIEELKSISQWRLDRIDSIKMGKWKLWHPRPVLIPAESFMEKDHDKQSHWIRANKLCNKYFSKK